jgi:hypothetical protein
MKCAEVENRTVMLTEENWIEVRMMNSVDSRILPSPQSPAIITNANPSKEELKKHKPLDEIHSVEKEGTKPGDPFPYAFRICFFSGSASSIAKTGLGKFKRLLQVGSTFDDFLKSKVIRCHSEEERDQWITVFHALLRNSWQKKFESTILPAPEIYKRHAFVIKDNNDRLIVLSDFWFYVSSSTLSLSHRGNTGKHSYTDSLFHLIFFVFVFLLCLDCNMCVSVFSLRIFFLFLRILK